MRPQIASNVIAKSAIPKLPIFASDAVIMIQVFSLSFVIHSRSMGEVAGMNIAIRWSEIICSLVI
jgi:hypothetical protein